MTEAQAKAILAKLTVEEKKQLLALLRQLDKEKGC